MLLGSELEYFLPNQKRFQICAIYLFFDNKTMP